jgi:hypothetical protein
MWVISNRLEESKSNYSNEPRPIVKVGDTLVIRVQHAEDKSENRFKYRPFDVRPQIVAPSSFQRDPGSETFSSKGDKACFRGESGICIEIIHTRLLVNSSVFEHKVRRDQRAKRARNIF